MTPGWPENDSGFFRELITAELKKKSHEKMTPDEKYFKRNDPGVILSRKNFFFRTLFFANECFVHVIPPGLQPGEAEALGRLRNFLNVDRQENRSIDHL